MKERPILMSAPMVLAILGGRKTQTRRAIRTGGIPHDEFAAGLWLSKGKRDMAAFSNVFHECVRAGVIKHNPCLDLRHESEPPRDRYVDDDELIAFANFTQDIELQARIAILWATGSRPGQIRVLPLSAWDGEGLTVAKGGKRGRGVRYTGEVLAVTIDALLSKRTGKRSASDLLFPNRSGEMYTEDGWRSRWQKKMKAYAEAGFDRFQERDIRAKTVTDEDSIITASDRVGHLQLSTTKRVYFRRDAQVAELDSARLARLANEVAS